MKSILKFKVQYADTDAYKVAWHGSYLRWMEAGRVDWLYLNGIDIKKLEEEENIVLPVIDLKIRYSRPAKLLDDIEVHTEVIDNNDIFLVFDQKVLKDGVVLTRATVRGTAVKDGKMVKSISEIVGGI